MPRKRAIPVGATRRTCPDCLQHFGYMTATQFELSWPLHLRSIRHNKWINAKNSAADRAAGEREHVATEQKRADIATFLAKARESLVGKLPPSAI
jgi:hypothetical protein